jgi:hypothetical protein
MTRSGAFRILVAIALLAIVLITRKEILERRPATTATVPAAGTVRTVAGPGVAPPGTAEAIEQARAVVRRAEVEGNKEVQLVCALSPGLKDGHGYLAIGGHSSMVGRNVEVFAGKVYVPYVFPKPRPDGKPVDAFPREGWLAIAGYGPVRIAWNEVDSLDAALRSGSGSGEGSGAEAASTERAHCVQPGSSTDAPATVELPSGVASVSGKVQSQATLGSLVKGAWVEGCGNRVLVEDDGSFSMPIVSEPCTLQAFRQPGAKRAKSAPMDVQPTPGKDLKVDLMMAG